MVFLSGFMMHVLNGIEVQVDVYDDPEDIADGDHVIYMIYDSIGRSIDVGESQVVNDRLKYHNCLRDWERYGANRAMDQFAVIDLSLVPEGRDHHDKPYKRARHDVEDVFISILLPMLNAIPRKADLPWPNIRLALWLKNRYRNDRNDPTGDQYWNRRSEASELRLHFPPSGSPPATPKAESLPE